MTGAIEFLRKAKEICNTSDINCKTTFDIIDYLSEMENALSPSEIVSKVMSYQIKEETHGTNK